jgi:hypothetical protein
MRLVGEGHAVAVILLLKAMAVTKAADMQSSESAPHVDVILSRQCCLMFDDEYCTEWNSD